MKQILVLLGIFIAISCQRSSTDDTYAYKTIVIKSVGEVEALPDMATFHLNLNCIDKSVKASKDCLVKKSNELTAQLLSFGVAKKDILTTAVNMNRSYAWRGNSQVFEGYRSSLTVTVTVKDIDKLDQIYTELLENRNLEVGGFNFEHSKIDSLQNEAYVIALQKSTKVTDKLLAKLPEDEKEILRISNVEMSASAPTPRVFTEQASTDAMAVSQQSISISNGTLRVAATLFVEYQIR
jgi:uncharacterized protein YggE